MHLVIRHWGRTRGTDDSYTGVHVRAPAGYGARMGLLRKAAVIGIAKKVYDEARKPHNQKKIKDAVEQLKARRGASRRPPH